METNAKEVVTDFLSAIQNGDNQKLAALIHPEIEWNQPGQNMVSGIKRSNAEVFEMVGRMFEISGNTLRLSEIKSVTVNGDHVACLLKWNAVKPSGDALTVDNIDVYTVIGEQITRAYIY